MKNEIENKDKLKYFGDNDFLFCFVFYLTKGIVCPQIELSRFLCVSVSSLAMVPQKSQSSGIIK